MFGAKDTSLIDMSWISLSPDHSNTKCGIDPVTILRFAVKYRLHPLAIHDAMTLGAQRPKVNEYNGDFFRNFTYFSIDQEIDGRLEGCYEGKNG